MKKITFILLALISGVSFAQSSDAATAVVNAEIVSPISITSSGVLDFAKLARTTEGGTVVLSPLNVVTFSDTDMEIASNSYSVPTFSVTAEEGQTYKVVAEGGELQSGTDGPKMLLDEITTSLEGDTGNSASDFTVGGRLNVSASQPSGDYTGEVKVTVSYE